MNSIYIFGHKRPDTDSVCASIAMAYFMNRANPKQRYVPRILGSINNETKFVLERFKQSVPKYLNDVKLQIRDINYKKKFFIDQHASIKDAYLLMNSNKTSGIPIVDTRNNNKLTGFITLKEIAKELIESNRRTLETSYDNILRGLSGQEILRFDEQISGNVMTVTFKSTTFLTGVPLDRNSILIVGDRHSILEYAVESGARLIILVGNSDIKQEHLDKAKEKRVNIIKTNKDSFDVSNLLTLCNYVINISVTSDPATIRDNDYVSYFEDFCNKQKYTNYPVVGSNDECLGLIRNTDINDKIRKRVILVDHNEKNQSVDGIEEAEIVEIIDHHRLGTISTSHPINFRNMSVGSTCTIIFSLFKQYNIIIPNDIAGLMLSAVLSDTLLLKSPTTTKMDVGCVSYLSNLLQLNYEEYGMEMFKAGSSLKGKSLDEIIFQDFKQFNTNDINIGIGQVFTTDYETIDANKDNIVKKLNEIAANNNYGILCLFVTDIIRNGSYVLFNDDAQTTISLAFGIENIQEGAYLQDIVSRKMQMISAIIDILEN